MTWLRSLLGHSGTRRLFPPCSLALVETGGKVELVRVTKITTRTVLHCRAFLPEHQAWSKSKRYRPPTVLRQATEEESVLAVGALQGVIKIAVGKNHFVLIDEPDLDQVWPYGWCATTTYGVHSKHTYASARIGGGPVFLHRWILGADQAAVVDHINGDGLNNRRENIRIGTQALNNANRSAIDKVVRSSKFKGVDAVPCASKKLWQARISHKNKTIFLGRFDDEEAAARAYDAAARELQGEFARLNFPG